MGERRKRNIPVTMDRRKKLSGLNAPHPMSTDLPYEDDELEFLLAMDRFKRDGHPFPTWRQVFWIFRGLGYRKG